MIYVSSLEAGSLYTFLVGDRVAEISMFGESQKFQIIAVATSSDADTDADAGGEDTVAEDAAGDGDGDDEDGFRWGVVIGSVAGI